MIQIQNLESEEFDRIDDDFCDIKEVDKIYKAPHFKQTGICNLVVKKKFKNLYIKKIDEILHGTIQNSNNRQFKYPPNQIKRVSENLTAKSVETLNKKRENKTTLGFCSYKLFVSDFTNIK